MPHALLSVALGLLLVHRMTHAYDRFWSGRRQWQTLADVSRRAMLWCGADDPGTAEDISALALALVGATEARVRSTRQLTFRASLASLVPRDLILRMEAASNPPLVCADALGRRVQAARASGLLSEEQAMELERSVDGMMTSAGAMDCIARTPTPFEYSAHTSRFLTLFCFSLPLVLAPLMMWWCLPTVLLVAYALLAIDEISAVVEAPFQGYLPLKELFAALRLDLGDLGLSNEGAGKLSRL